jgi:flagellum-specific ATP synthase
VGKSTLLGMIARNMKADVNVIALIGERGREVLEFIERNLGDAGLRRSVVVVATADQPPLLRTRAAHAATAIAEYFRDQGQDVLLIMDSITRFAAAHREIGLAIGEPPTARGYTPSVFAALPKLLERCGTIDRGGSISAIYSVLVEGDDLNDPIADALRAMLDGHIVLSRELANQGHFPAIDVLASVSRVMPHLIKRGELDLVQNAIGYLSAYARSKDMIEIGAYRAGANAELDRAVERHAALDEFLRQDMQEAFSREQALQQLRAAIGMERV